MNRFEFAVAEITENESVVMKDEHIKIYDGQDKVCILKIKLRFHLFVILFTLDVF